MKLFSKRGSRVIKFEPAIEHEEVRYTPDDYLSSEEASHILDELIPSDAAMQIQSEPVQPDEEEQLISGFAQPEKIVQALVEMGQQKDEEQMQTHIEQYDEAVQIQDEIVQPAEEAQIQAGSEQHEETAEVQNELLQPEGTPAQEPEATPAGASPVDIEQKLFEDAFKPQEISKGKLRDITNDATQANVQKAPQASQTPQEFVYPESTLTKTQLAAIQRVIGTPQNGEGAGDENADEEVSKKSDGSDSQSIPEGSSTEKQKQRKAKKRPPEATELRIKDRSVIKTVFFVIFLILILGAGAYAGFYYWWTEHATFDYMLQPVVVLEGQGVVPDDFLYPAEEMAGVTAVFNDPDFEPFVGLQFVPMTLSSRMRTLESAAALYVLTPIEYMEHEFAEEGAILRPVEFLKNPEIAASISFEISFIEPPLPLEEYPVGEFLIKLSLNGVPFEVTLIVSDTTAPVAVPVEVTIQIGQPVNAEMFVEDVYDASGIKSISFAEEPDVYARVDYQDVRIAIEDNNGNITEISSILYTVMTQSDPILEVLHHTIESQVGNPVNYLEGVSAYDEFDNPLAVYVIDDDVNVDEAGTYTAILRAEDLSGMYTEVLITVHIINSNPDDVNRRVDEILARIITPDMTQTEKAYAIHRWFRSMSNMSRSTTDRSAHSITDEAARALDARNGNSRAFSSLASFMLTRAGVENIQVERIPDASVRHNWLIINIEGEGWYHFDPFPTGIIALGTQTYKFTEKQAREFAQRIRSHVGTEDYYTFVTTDMPAIVQE